MKNKVLIIILILVATALGIVYFQKHDVSAGSASVADMIYPGYSQIYQSWSQSSTRKSNDKLFESLVSLSTFPASYPAISGESTILDFNGDSLSDIVFNYSYTNGSSGSNSSGEDIVVVMLYLNNGIDGYDEYYKCAMERHSTGLNTNYYGDCAE